MRKIITVILILFSLCSIAQRPLKIVDNKGGINRFKAWANFILPSYIDTTAANLDLGNDSCGAIIFTYTGNSIYKRGCSPKKWINISAVATAVPLSGITAATVANDINNSQYAQRWRWNTLAQDSSAMSWFAQLNATPTAAQLAFRFDVTTAGSAAQPTVGLYSILRPGYTGSSQTFAGSFNNTVLGTGNTLIPAAGSNAVIGNFGANAGSTGSVAGLNAGFVGFANGGDISAGLVGVAQFPQNSSKNIGVVGSAINTGTSPVQIGGWFSLNQTTVPTVSAALIADNGSQANPILLARDNGTTVFGIGDGGSILLSGSAGTSGNFLQSAGAGTPPIWTSTVAATSVPLNGITAATGSNSIDNLNNTQTWTWSTSNTTGLILNSTYTTKSNNTTTLSVTSSGVQAGGVQTYGFRASNTNTGSASQNIGARFSATGATTNTAIAVAASEGSVGIGTITPSSTLEVAGSVGFSYAAKTSTYAVTSTDYTIDCTSGTFTVTLPTAVGIQGRVYIIKNSGAGIVTVGTTGSQNIDASTTYTLPTLYKYVSIQSNNASWIVIANN